MKNILLYILFIISLLSSSSLKAQNKEYKGTMLIAPMQLKQVGDSLHIGIDFNMQEVKVNSRSSISLIPILVGKNKNKKLAEIMVKGRANYLISKRELALMSKKERQLYEQNTPYTIIKGYKSNEQKQFLYRQTIAFEPWMRDAQLDIEEELCGCGNKPHILNISQLVNQIKLEPIISQYKIIPNLAYLQPEDEAVKKREIIGEAFLDFAVNKTTIRLDYMNNPRELEKITNMIMELRNDPSIEVKDISIIGYASPEGTLEFNQYLSEGRANAMVNYLLPKFDYPKNMYNVKFEGENWEGLMVMVDSSKMQYRDEVMKVLKTFPKEMDYKTNIKYKTTIKELLNGEPYRYMLKMYFPSLRKAICKVDYEIRKFNVTEAKEVFKKQPRNLSIYEMYMVANTYKAGTPEFINVLETAATIYQEDQTAILNAASAALSIEDTTTAERYLNKIKSRVRIPEYDNAMGVLEMLKGNYDKAEGYLKSAADTGLESAKQNLVELHRKLKNIEIIKKQFE